MHAAINMNNGFDVPRGIKNMLVYVVEYSCRNNEYIEGQKLLAQTITHDPAENRTEVTTYFADGSVHSKIVTTGDADCRKSIVYRYESSGRLRDKWLITYNSDGSRASAYTYDSQGKLEEHPFEKEGATTFYNPEQIEDDEELFERELDVRGNWIKETRFEKKTEEGKLVDVPRIVIYRTITYL